MIRILGSLVALRLQILTLLFFIFMPLMALAQAAAPAPINPDTTFFTHVLQLIGSFGGLPWMAKVSAICLLIVGLTKTSFIAPLWAKLPPLLQTLTAPLLALIGGLISQGSLTWASALAYLGAGAGAVIVHEILDGIKTIPGIGATYVAIINVVEGLLGGPGPTTPAA